MLVPNLRDGHSRFLFFFFNDTATTEIYTLSLHDALPIFSSCGPVTAWTMTTGARSPPVTNHFSPSITQRSEEHTSELQSPCNLVCRLLLEKKKKDSKNNRLPLFSDFPPEYERPDIHTT